MLMASDKRWGGSGRYHLKGPTYEKEGHFSIISGIVEFRHCNCFVLVYSSILLSGDKVMGISQINILLDYKIIFSNAVNHTTSTATCIYPL